MDSTLDKRIAAMRGSLMDTALEAAESRGQRLAGVAHVLYALYRDDGFAERGARGHGLGAADVHGRHGRWTEGAHAPRHRGADVAGVP